MSEEQSRLGELFDKAMEAEGLMDKSPEPAENLREEKYHQEEEKATPDRKYLSIYDGENEIKIPEDAKVKLSTKNGESMELSVHDWATAPWSQRENAKIVEAKNQLQTKMNELVGKYGDLDNLLSADPKDIRGKDWATQIIKTIYDMNPSRGDDLKEFFESIQKGTLSAQDVKQAELQRENLRLKKGEAGRMQEASAAELGQYSNELCGQIMEETGVSPEEFQSKLQKLGNEGKLPSVKDKEELKSQASMVYGEFLIDKADKAIKELGLSNEEVMNHQKDIVGLLYADPKQTANDLAKKLNALIGRPTAKAKEKVAQLKKDRTEGLKHVPSPKPNNTKARTINNKSPFTHLEEKYGDIFS